LRAGLVRQYKKNHKEKKKVMSKPELKKISSPGVEAGKAAATESNNKSQPSAAELAEGGSIDKIRDILFGSQSRDFEKKVARLEERLTKESVDLRDEIKRRFDSLESYAKKELESLGDRLKTEQSERLEVLKELSREVKETSKSLEKKVAQLDDQAVKSQRELRQQILDQSKSLADEIRQKYESLGAVLDREAQDLRKEKIDRTALADLFTELAMRLNDEFKLPGRE